MLAISHRRMCQPLCCSILVLLSCDCNMIFMGLFWVIFSLCDLAPNELFFLEEKSQAFLNT